MVKVYSTALQTCKAVLPRIVIAGVKIAIGPRGISLVGAAVNGDLNRASFGPLFFQGKQHPK